jgi:hypothetical protein
MKPPFRKGDHIDFFTGYSGSDGTQFEIYNINSDTWVTGKLDQTTQGAAIISVNNTSYVAGGTVYANHVGNRSFKTIKSIL